MTVISVQAQDWFKVHGRGWVAFIVNDPRQIPDDYPLVGLLNHQVNIDGKEYTVTSVELRGQSRDTFGLVIRGER